MLPVPTERTYPPLAPPKSSPVGEDSKKSALSEAKAPNRGRLEGARWQILRLRTSVNKQPQTHNIEKQHKIKQHISALWCCTKLLPYKNAPEGGDNCCTLALTRKRNGRTSLTRCYDAERHSQAPDCTAKYPCNMIFKAAFKIGAESHRSAGEWPSHQQGIKQEVA